MRRSSLAPIILPLECSPLPQTFNREGRQGKPLSSQGVQACGFFSWANLTTSSTS
jgi:hypothetical protein